MPDRDSLETWGDSEPVAGVAAISQPAIRPLGQARPAIESFARWSGAGASAHDLVKSFWQESVYPRQDGQENFEAFWKKSVEAGFAHVRPQRLALRPFDLQAVKPIVAERASGEELALVLYAKPAMPDGRHAYNPWLHELPDPVTKATWDNYACLSGNRGAHGPREGDDIRLQITGTSIELPVLSTGQHEKVVAVGLGMTLDSGRFADTGPKWVYGGLLRDLMEPSASTPRGFSS